MLLIVPPSFFCVIIVVSSCGFHCGSDRIRIIRLPRWSSWGGGAMLIVNAREGSSSTYYPRNRRSAPVPGGLLFGLPAEVPDALV